MGSKSFYKKVYPPFSQSYISYFFIKWSVSYLFFELLTIELHNEPLIIAMA